CVRHVQDDQRHEVALHYPEGMDWNDDLCLRDGTFHAANLKRGPEDYPRGHATSGALQQEGHHRLASSRYPNPVVLIEFRADEAEAFTAATGYSPAGFR